MSADGGSDLLAPAVLDRLERLQLTTRRRLAGGLAGPHRSPRHGSTVDFADHRPYQPGDDLRRVDQRAWARLDRLLVRLYEAEDEITVRLLVDTSASMATGGKARAAAQVAAAIGFVALVSRDVVTLRAFPADDPKRPPRRFRGRGDTPALLRTLATLPASGHTPFADAAADLLGRPGPAGLTVVVSDLLTPEWERGLARLPARGDLVVVHVLGVEDLDPSAHGDLDLVDVESGATVAVSLTESTRRAYVALVERWLDEVEARCQRAGAGYVRLTDDIPVDATLLATWQREGILR